MRIGDNRAVPKYYGEFRDAVIRGDIPVCQEISMEMNRIDSLIADPDMYYVPEAVDGFLRFCETELTLTDGSDMWVLPAFKLWAEQLFGWYHHVEREVATRDGRFETKRLLKRLTQKQYIIVARGSAKSMYDAALHAYFLSVDTSTTHQITTAPTLKMAEEVISPFRTAIARARGPLFSFLTEGSIQNTTGNRALRQKLVSTKKGVENFLTNSLMEARPMTVNKLQGLRPKVSTVDEWLSGDTREDVVGAIEQGASKLSDYVIVATSSEGTVRNGAGDTIKMELLKILKGEMIAPHVSIWYYKLDNVKEVGDPKMWLKAQPHLGLTVTYDTYQRDVERAEANPSQRNDILAKRFGLPLEGYTYYFTYEETIPHKPQNFDGLECALGVDLSRGDDFCAFTFLFPLGNGRFGVKTLGFITERTLDSLPLASRAKYQEFIDEGTLVIEPGATLDLLQVYDELDAHIIEHNYAVLCVGYDPYNAREFMERWERHFGPYGIEKVIQGAKTESVPLGELKKQAEDRTLIFDQTLMAFCMGNAVTAVDTNGNRKLMKRSREEKIDSVSALVDARVAYQLHRDLFE